MKINTIQNVNTNRINFKAAEENIYKQTSEKIKVATQEAMKKNNVKKSELPIIECKSLEEAVAEARDLAQENDVVFFSPASASFDMFKLFSSFFKIFKHIKTCTCR